VGGRKGEGGRRKEEGGRRKEEGGRRKEEGGRRKEEGGRRKEEGGRGEGGKREGQSLLIFKLCQVASEHLRIPSTRNIAILGRYENVPTDPEEVQKWKEEIEENQKKLLEAASYQKFEPKVRKSSSHRG
jgi:ATP-dependent RNA helicase DHX57